MSKKTSRLFDIDKINRALDKKKYEEFLSREWFLLTCLTVWLTKRAQCLDADSLKYFFKAMSIHFSHAEKVFEETLAELNKQWH